MKQMNIWVIKEERKQLEIPKFILSLKEQKNTREDNIRRILELLGADQYGIRYEELVRVIELEGLGTRKEIYQKVAQEKNKVAGTVLADSAFVIKKIWTDSSNRAIFQELMVDTSKKVPSIKIFSSIIMEYIRFLEGKISEKEMKVGRLLHSLDIPYGFEGYEIFVKEIMEKIEEKPCEEFVPKRKVVSKRKNEEKSTRAHNIFSVLEDIWNNPANEELLQKMGFTSTEYKPTLTEIIKAMRKYIENGNKEEFRSPNFILELKKKGLSREENIRSILAMLNMSQYAGYEYLVQAIAIQCEKRILEKEMYQKISQDEKWRRIQHSIKRAIEQAGEDEANKQSLKEMKLLLDSKELFRRYFIPTIVEYIKILESEMTEQEIEARNFLGCLKAPKYKNGYEEVVKELIVYKEKKAKVDKKLEIQELDEKCQAFIKQVEYLKTKKIASMGRLIEAWDIKEEPRILQKIGFNKYNENYIFKEQLIQAIIDYMKLLEEAS